MARTVRKKTEAAAAQNRIIWGGLGFCLMAQYSFLLPLYYTTQVCTVAAAVCAVVVVLWKIIE